MTKFGQYIAWLNGTSVKRGDVAEVTAYAIEVFNSQAWQDRHQGKPTILRITKGARQTLVSEVTL